MSHTYITRAFQVLIPDLEEEEGIVKHIRKIFQADFILLKYNDLYLTAHNIFKLLFHDFVN